MEFHAEGAQPSDVHDVLVTVLLEYVFITSNGTNGWQHLLHQYDAIITALVPGLTKMRFVHPDKYTASVFGHPRVILPCQTIRATSNVSQGSVATVSR